MLEPGSSAPPPTSFRPATRRGPYLVVFLLFVIAGAAGYWVYRTQQEAAARQASTPPQGVAVVTPPPVAEDEAPTPGLPLVDESDDFVREHAVSLSHDPNVQRWLKTPGLIRHFVSATATMADGETPRGTFSFLAPSAPFPVITRNRTTLLSDRGYARYDALGVAAESLDVPALATLLKNIEPLCNHVWKEIAPTGSTYRQSLDVALTRLAGAADGAAALPAGQEVRLVPKGGVWAFADPALEAKTPLEKQLLRMGPANATRIGSKAKALHAALFGK